LPTVGTIGRLAEVLLAATDKLLLGQQTRDCIADLAGYLFQVDQRTRRR
jgi:hypothetical protein